MTQSGEDLGIADVADRTGIAAGTIRMWEQRYGFPEPQRTASGYRRYQSADVEALRRVAAYRHRGLSVPAAIERARESAAGAVGPSLYAAVRSGDHGATPQVLRKSTLVAISRAIEHELLATGSTPMIFGAFQRAAFYREVEPRYQRMAMHADSATVFADFDEVRHTDSGVAEIPIDARNQLGNEWAVIVDAPGYCACLLAWEQPGITQPGDDADMTRRFEAIWTIDARATRRAAQAAVRLVSLQDPVYGQELEALLTDRPLALEEPNPGLTALTNRVVAYLEN